MKTKRPKPATATATPAASEESFAETCAAFMAMDCTIDPAALREAVAKIKRRRRMTASQSGR